MRINVISNVIILFGDDEFSNFKNFKILQSFLYVITKEIIFEADASELLENLE